MSILAFQKPDKVVMLEATDFYGKFEFRPLEPGYGMTIGNALRRILLSSLEGFAISSVKIDGVDHEFSTIPGVMEDVTEIILQLKQVRFKQQIEDVNHENVSVVISGQQEFRAGDIGKFLSGFPINWATGLAVTAFHAVGQGIVYILKQGCIMLVNFLCS